MVIRSGFLLVFGCPICDWVAGLGPCGLQYPGGIALVRPVHDVLKCGLFGGLAVSGALLQQFSVAV